MATSEPLLLIGFNRPELFGQLIARLSETQPSKIYVAIDGPRVGNPTDLEKVTATRDLVNSIDWPCKVETLFQEHNLGCGQGVSTALNWFFAHEERGIILEDDILPKASFFGFCSELLDRYEDDDRVLAISGCNFVPPEFVTSGGEYRFSRVPHIWGWATWRRSWVLHDLDISDWSERMPPRKLWQVSGRSVSGFIFWRSIFDLLARGAIDTWDLQFVFAGMDRNMLTATANTNLIDNIGWGITATHTSDRPKYLRTSENIELPIGPITVEVDEKADAWSRRVVFGASSVGLIKQTYRYLKQRVLK